ncbi:hypothetical protein [Aequorivita marina]|uniref:hypothetical protein n=1 Tax=Aequorivita marina TaxID=3073654 RepID=UPI002875B50C|nr:hypothetical protein [Aequorivita sp. S2608]MDS1298719.1 hypothetical protein [Aequorivita sp. S2608]
MKREQHHTNQEILNGLIESCLNFNPSHFIPHLLSKKVITDMPNKVRFYKFYKYMLLCAKENSVGHLTFRIEKPIWEKDKSIEYYNLYDSKHKYSRLSIVVKKTDEKIFIDTMPF